MKLNSRRSLLGLLLLVASVVVSLILLQDRAKTSDRVDQASENHTATSPPESPSATATGNSVDQSADSNFVEIKKQRELKLHQFFNTPIDFFGKVVDENQVPISGASTYYIVASASFEGSPTQEGPKTNEAGFFSITGKRGPDFSVRVEHSDYYQTESADQKIEYARRDYMPGKEPPLPPSRENPTIFILRKRGVAEPLVHQQEVRVRLPFNGNQVRINMETGEIGQGKKSLLVTMRSDGDKLPLNTFYPFDWSVKIQVLGGGLVERTDMLNFEAPTDGYVSELVVKMPASLPRSEWKSWVQKDFFVSFATGNYGRVRLNISGEKGRCIAETFLNPTPGSRNLEFDPTKVVKSP
jgi:hypothetical protein